MNGFVRDRGIQVLATLIPNQPHPGPERARVSCHARGKRAPAPAEHHGWHAVASGRAHPTIETAPVGQFIEIRARIFGHEARHENRRRARLTKAPPKGPTAPLRAVAVTVIGWCQAATRRRHANPSAASATPMSVIDAGSGTRGGLPAPQVPGLQGSPAKNVSGPVPNENCTFEIVVSELTPDRAITNVAGPSTKGLNLPSLMLAFAFA
jgi:hypothetical protein